MGHQEYAFRPTQNTLTKLAKNEIFPNGRDGEKISKFLNRPKFLYNSTRKLTDLIIEPMTFIIERLPTALAPYVTFWLDFSFCAKSPRFLHMNC